MNELKILWKAKIQERLKLLLWKLAWDILPIKEGCAKL